MKVLRIAVHEEVIENTVEINLSFNKPGKEFPVCHGADVIKNGKDNTENLGKEIDISKVVKRFDDLTFDGTLCEAVEKVDVFKGLSWGIPLKVVMKPILCLKSNPQGVKKGSNDARAELSCARPVRAWGEEILVFAIFKPGKNSDNQLVRNLLKVREVVGRPRAVLSWLIAHLSTRSNLSTAVGWGTGLRLRPWMCRTRLKFDIKENTTPSMGKSFDNNKTVETWDVLIVVCVKMKQGLKRIGRSIGRGYVESVIWTVSSCQPWSVV